VAINIGNEAVKCVQELRGQPDFARLLDALAVTVRDRIYACMNSPPELRVQQTAHAQGMHELLEAIGMAFEGKLASQMNKVAPPGNPKFRRTENDVAANV